MDKAASGSRHINVTESYVPIVCLLHTTVHFISAAAASFYKSEESAFDLDEGDWITTTI